MYTKELLPILKEFKGMKSHIRLVNGEIVSGSVGDLHNLEPQKQDPAPIVNILDDANNIIAVFVCNIIALKLA